MARTLLALLTVLLVTNLALAGLFIPGDRGELLPKDGKVNALSFDRFRDKLSDAVGAGVDLPEPSSVRKDLLAKREELQQRFRRLKVDELLILGGVCYRLNDPDGALAAWREAAQQAPRDPRAMSNLSLLYLVRGDLLQARQYQSLIKELRPSDLPELTPDHAAWLARVEGYFRKLLRNRHMEARQNIPMPQLTPDDLFDVQFVGENGTYQVGSIAAAQREKLPEDAIAIVQQLLFWMPHDSRLRWLLAELYNATGEPAAALTLMNECADNRRFRPDLLREHQRSIDEELTRLREEEANKDFRKHPEVLWAAAIIGGVIITALVAWQVWIIIRRLTR